jgi:hypothetical protein
MPLQLQGYANCRTPNGTTVGTTTNRDVLRYDALSVYVKLEAHWKCDTPVMVMWQEGSTLATHLGHKEAMDHETMSA